MPSPTTAATAHKRLDRLSGMWNTSGELLQGRFAAKAFRGKDSYRWLPGEKFLLHRWDIRMPDGRKQGIEVFGFDKGSRTVNAHSFDSDGNALQMTVDLGKDVYRFAGDAMRFTGTFEEHDTEIVGLWELLGKKGWEPWMRIRLARSPARV